MKKLESIIVFLVLFICILEIKANAYTLDNLDISVDKELIRPGDTINLTINFNKDLLSYIANVAYDSNLFEFISVQTGENYSNEGYKIKINYESISEPRNNIVLAFKAKENLITTTPTDLSVTLENMNGQDGLYYDAVTSLKKDLIIEPSYTDYNINLQYDGEIIENEEKNIRITISSSLAKNYEKARIVATAMTPVGETVKFLGIDEQGIEHEIIQNGWGNPEGYMLGGKDIVKILDVRGIFSGPGEYAITLKIIDKKNNDEEIASQNFTINVKEETNNYEDELLNNNINEQQNNVSENEIQNNISGIDQNFIANNINIEAMEIANEIKDMVEEGQNSNINNVSNETPKKLPKTGNTVYVSLGSIIVVLLVAYYYLKKK